jgi:glycosyltransferase involved in cell wall biosynthesis
LIHINEPLAGGLSSLLSRKVRIIPNGYDPEQFDTYRGRVSKEPPFTISFVGTLHANTNPYVFLEGFRMFSSRRNLAPSDCRVSFTGDGFWGVKEVYRRFDEIESFVSLDRAVPQNQAVERMCSAHVLLLFPLDMEGCTPAKTFEYLASGRPILVTPDGKHRGAIKDILNRTGAGLVVDSAEEIAQWLDVRYEEFQRTGEVASEADSKHVTLYSRKEQTRQVAEILDALSEGAGVTQDQGVQSS